MSSSLSSAWIVGAVMACNAQNQKPSTGPRPDSAVAGCTSGIYGGGSYTTIRSGGAITTTFHKPNEPKREQSEPRDRSSVDALLGELARLPWSTLKTTERLYDVRCSIQVMWSDTSRWVEWLQPSRNLAELVEVHGRILALSTSERNPDSTPTQTVPTTNPEGDTARQGVQAQSDSVKPLLETGCGGGVTGGGRGTFVTASGDFYSYQRNGPSPVAKRILTFLRRDSVRAMALVDAAVRDGITRVSFSEPSNWTCHLSLSRPDTSHFIAWPGESTPAPIRKLIAVAKQLEAAAAGRK